MVAHELIALNGVDGATGDYMIKPLELSRVAALVGGEPQGQRSLGWLGEIAKRLRKPHLGLPLGVDPADVAQAGWGLVFHTEESAEVRGAIDFLAGHRGDQTGTKAKRLEYRDGETRRRWLTRNGVAAGNVDPERVPYYLLLIGSPTKIPYEFQLDLAVEYAVGRLDLPEADDYKRYATSIVEYETSDVVPTTRSAVFFGTKHASDPATSLSADHLVTPLAASVGNGFEPVVYVGAEATKERFLTIIGGNDGPRPAFLFTATHGLGWPRGHLRQVDEQGALVCHGWRRFAPLDSRHYVAATDVNDDAHVHGMVAFHFACYGAGTPDRDDFATLTGSAPVGIADAPFVARLPCRLLSHANGGALAIVGHVERAWGCSFVTPGAGPQLRPFRNAASAILKGLPVGYAMKDFNERYAALSVDVSTMLRNIGAGASLSEAELAQAWLERNDARNYVVLGDPAVRLRVADIKGA